MNPVFPDLKDAIMSRDEEAQVRAGLCPKCKALVVKAGYHAQTEHNRCKGCGTTYPMEKLT